ncbi:hypothetical protein NA57DRAFT_74012 [Rhizodiscina lignyota]|uniref:Uncharacterized protein n=1 Tax=Rhizodiscina lignyota TaxID=1504668 RepID=A0A9P4IF35_9PEZI|nr:hypothetical protein NA57DRAFT_74012 [Rhizodiscina lignyota]
MESVIQAVVNLSKVDIKHVRIAGSTADSFLFTLDAQVYRTGPFYATISAMSLDLVGPKGRYAKLELPQISITPRETRIRISDQKIEILDMSAFHATTEHLTKASKATLNLENGQGTVKMMGISFPLKFSKKCEILGMAGPRTEFFATDDGGDAVFAKVWNPSPLELDLGIAEFECRNADGRAVARVRGRMGVLRGESKHEMDVVVTAEDNMTSAVGMSELWMVGVGVEGDTDTWMNEAIRSYNIELPLTPEMLRLIGRKKNEVLAANGVTV